MKRLLSILSFVCLTTLVAPIGAAESPTKPEVPQPTPTPVAAKVDYKDAFLSFTLEKAKLYSEKGEVAISKAVDVATTEAPILATEYIRWRFWYHLLHVILPITFVLLMVTLFTLCAWASGRTKSGEVGEACGLDMGISGVAGVCGLIFGFFSLLVNDPTYPEHGGERGHLYSLVQVTTAPRVYVIEQVINLAKR